MTLWRVGPEDLRPLLLIAILPLLVALPLLLGILDADPAMRDAGMTSTARGVSAIGLRIHLPGAPVIDNNAGLTRQALGYRAAFEILHGRMPWWNAYSGVGLPLAAEYQAAAFFPLTFLLLLPQGALIEHLLLQILAGWGAYALLRQLNIGRLAALAAGVLYAFNGTLAWFDQAAALPLPFLPWMLFGIERARVKAQLGLHGGWRIFAPAVALTFLAGFPEAAYLNGLMALAWAALRLVESRPQKRWAFAWRIGLGGAIGLSLAAPQIFAFLQYLPNAVVPGHEARLVGFNLDSADVIPSLLAPYIFGPLYGFTAFDAAHIFFFTIFVYLGGYVSATILLVATYGLLARPNRLGWFLAGWILLALGQMFGVQPAAWLWNHVPGANLVLICRYIQPTLLLALVILAANGLDDLGRRPPRVALLGAGFVGLAAVGVCATWAAAHWTSVHAIHDWEDWVLGSLGWVFVSVVICIGTLARPGRYAPVVLTILVMAESAIMFAIPTLSNPPGGARLDMAAVAFLRENLGQNRFYTMGPIAPNYGAYFEIASINETSSPAPRRWADWLPHLDAAASVVAMMHPFPQRSLIQEMHRKLATFEWTGVKYILAAPYETRLLAAELKLRTAYSDAVMTIYELPHPSPYFEIVAGRCNMVPLERASATVDCSTPAVLLRRELFYPGWNASVNGTSATITAYKNLFQAIALPRGRSTVRFTYAPPHIIWMWLAALLGLAGLAMSFYRPPSQKKGHCHAAEQTAVPPCRTATSLGEA